MKIAFDIDGTLKKEYKDCKWLIRELKKFSDMGHDVIVWSGGGVDYAERYVERLKLPARVIVKCSEEVDIAFDDATDHIRGAKITIQVPPTYRLL